MYPARIEFCPIDRGAKWKRNVIYCRTRLRQCERAMERTRGTSMNMSWLYWSGEWDTAFSWLRDTHPEVACQMVEAGA